MKIFKVFLIGLYAFIVLGSVQTYSSQYNGQEIFSFVGIVDNFIISAIPSAIIYGIGLLIRKIYLKHSVTFPPTTSETLHTSPPDTSEPKNSNRVWQFATPVLIILILMSIYLNFYGEDASFPVPPPSKNTAQTHNDSWIPSDFREYSEDDNFAFRSANVESCANGRSFCWSLIVISRDGCPSGIYSEIAILDRSGVQIDFAKDRTTRVLPNSKVKLNFDTFDEEADSAMVSAISCR